MAQFKVIEIINATTIKVDPQWAFSNPPIGVIDLVDDKVRIAGLNVDDNNSFIRNRLQSFLLNQSVDLFNPVLITNPIAKIQCNVVLGGTDILYYFPEVSGATGYAIAP